MTDNTILDSGEHWKYTDLYDPEESMLCYGFDLQKLEDEAPIYSDPVFKSVLTFFAELQNQEDAALRNEDFVVYIGDAGNYFWIGVPDRLPLALTEMLRQFFLKMPAFETMQGGKLPYMPLIPWFRYTAEKAIWYSDETMVGKVQKDEAYGSGLVMHYLLVYPDIDLQEKRELRRLGIYEDDEEEDEDNDDE